MAIGTYSNPKKGKPKPKVKRVEKVDTTREFYVYRVTFDNGRQILVRVHRKYGSSAGLAKRAANNGERQLD